MKIITSLGLILNLLILKGCCVYYPQNTDIPLIKQKNDLRIDAGVSLIPSINASVAYGLSDKFALHGFGSIGINEARYFQLAPGLYKNYPTRTVFEIYTGFGAGYGDSKIHLYGNYQLYYLQLDFGRNDCKFLNMDYGMGLKTGYFHSNLTYREFQEGYTFEKQINQSILFEPVAFIRVGGKKLKLSIKAEACRIFQLANTDEYISTQPYNIGLGLNYYFKSIHCCPVKNSRMTTGSHRTNC